MKAAVFLVLFHVDVGDCTIILVVFHVDKDSTCNSYVYIWMVVILL